MHRQLPCAKVERAVLTYLRVREDYSGYHSSQGHPLLHRGRQGSGVPYQCDPSPVEIRR